MPNVTLNVEVYCSCGEGLCNQTDTSQDRYGNPALTVTPCEKCLKAAHDEGFDEGFDDVGFDEGQRSL